MEACLAMGDRVPTATGTAMDVHEGTKHRDAALNAIVARRARSPGIRHYGEGMPHYILRLRGPGDRRRHANPFSATGRTLPPAHDQDPPP
jgi:hypothetical protein